MQFVNLTPHPVTVIVAGETMLDVPPSGAVARLVETTTPAGDIGGIPVTAIRLGGVDGLPEPVTGTVYVASMPLCMGLKAAGITRDDVVYPFPQVRDGSGRIIGCGGFATVGEPPAVTAKERVKVATDAEGRHQLVRDETEPLSDGGIGSWASANQIMQPATDLVDQEDTPHLAGLTVVRRDADGWYVRVAPCDNGEGNTLDGVPCDGDAEESLASEGISDISRTHTRHTCGSCLEQEEMDR